MGCHRQVGSTGGGETCPSPGGDTCHRQVGSTGEGRVGDLRGGVS